MIIDKDLQSDVRKYTYCTEANQKPYEGSYGDTPGLWVDKFFVIRNTLQEYKERIRERNEKKLKNK